MMKKKKNKKMMMTKTKKKEDVMIMMKRKKYVFKKRRMKKKKNMMMKSKKNVFNMATRALKQRASRALLPNSDDSTSKMIGTEKVAESAVKQWKETRKKREKNVMTE